MSIQIRVGGLVMSAIVTSAASAQTAIEWKVSEGGNGHWYQRINQADGVAWSTARAKAENLGGHLATISTAPENEFVYQACGSFGFIGPWLGGYQLPGSVEPAGGWSWVTGEPWQFSAWDVGQPDSGCPLVNENALHLFNGIAKWNDIGELGRCGSDGPVTAFMVEWDADCNNDGIVDYGQIRSGQLADDNTNGIPDICETSITGVLPPSVPAQGGSTITINGRNFPAQPSLLVGGVAATNVVRISDSRLTAVTPPLLPGMAPLTVNGYTLPDAIYIRPECGSDLDQNGTVDAGDISIILLDFGPCYEPPAALADPAPTPLLADEPAQKPTQR